MADRIEAREQAMDLRLHGRWNVCVSVEARAPVFRQRDERRLTIGIALGKHLLETTNHCRDVGDFVGEVDVMPCKYGRFCALHALSYVGVAGGGRCVPSDAGQRVDDPV
jgi:hypothetical protein